jgi:hypothetical protein
LKDSLSKARFSDGVTDGNFLLLFSPFLTLPISEKKLKAKTKFLESSQYFQLGIEIS